MSQITTQTNTPRVSPLTVMAARFNADPAKLLDTLKATVFAAARNNEELQALVIVANAYNLNPLTKEIYAFPAKGGGIVPVVSVDGWANLANSHPQMDGVDFEWEHAGTKLISCTCVVYRKDRGHPIRITEYLDECKRNTDPWKMEHRMLRHKAFCQAVRIAFGFSGIYDEDEADRVNNAQDVTPQKPLSFDVAPTLEEPAATNQEQPEETPLQTFILFLNEQDKTQGWALERFCEIRKTQYKSLADVPTLMLANALEDWDGFIG